MNSRTDSGAGTTRILGISAFYHDSAAALLVAGEVDDWLEGAEEAAEALDKGLANALLDCWIAAVQ